MDLRREPGPGQSGFYRFTQSVALAGGFAVVLVSVLTVVSVIGRYLFSTPITGDYEIVEYGISVAAFSFLAFTHVTNSHIVAEFFSSSMSERLRGTLDLVQNLILFAILVILVWCVVLGGIDKFETGDESMFLRLKSWWLHVIGAFGLGLFALAALYNMCRRPGR